MVRQDNFELSSTDYQPYQQLIHSHDHNAFGDDSDSQANLQQTTPDDYPPPEFDVYKDFNNSGIKYTTLLHPTSDQPEQDPQDQDRKEFKDGHSNKIQSLNLPSEKTYQNRAQDHSFLHQPLSSSASHSRFQVNQLDSNKHKGKLFQLKHGKNRWKIGSIITFLLIACLGIMIFFLMPRQPFISFESPPRLMKKEDNNLVFSASKPTNFSFDAQLEILLDSRPSYLPTLVRDFKVIISDLGATSDAVQIGKTKTSNRFTASNKNLTPVTVDIHFEYTTKLPSDTLWQTWRQACGNIAQSTINGTITRPSLQLVVLIEFKVIGMIGTRYDSTQINNVGCPAELPVGAPSF